MSSDILLEIALKRQRRYWASLSLLRNGPGRMLARGCSPNSVKSRQRVRILIGKFVAILRAHLPSVNTVIRRDFSPD